jgi:heme/copper-type cytochrome/quinol oxidase subunit 3
VQRLVGAHGVTSRRTAIFEMCYLLLHGGYVGVLFIMFSLYSYVGSIEREMQFQSSAILKNNNF